jgi:hypothetical protein
MQEFKEYKEFEEYKEPAFGCLGKRLVPGGRSFLLAIQSDLGPRRPLNSLNSSRLAELDHRQSVWLQGQRQSGRILLYNADPGSKGLFGMAS